MKTKVIALLTIILVSCEGQNGELITPDKDETINPKEEIVQPKFTVIDTVISGYRPMIENLEVPVTVADLDYTITENGKPFEQSQACYLDVLCAGDKHLIVLNGAGGGVNPQSDSNRKQGVSHNPHSAGYHAGANRKI